MCPRCGGHRALERASLVAVAGQGVDTAIALPRSRGLVIATPSERVDPGLILWVTEDEHHEHRLVGEINSSHKTTDAHAPVTTTVPPGQPAGVRDEEITAAVGCFGGEGRAHGPLSQSDWCKRVNLRVGCHAHNNQPRRGYFEEYVLARIAPRSWDPGRPDVFVINGLMA